MNNFVNPFFHFTVWVYQLLLCIYYWIVLSIADILNGLSTIVKGLITFNFIDSDIIRITNKITTIAFPLIILLIVAGVLYQIAFNKGEKIPGFFTKAIAVPIGITAFVTVFNTILSIGQSAVNSLPSTFAGTSASANFGDNFLSTSIFINPSYGGPTPATPVATMSPSDFIVWDSVSNTFPYQSNIVLTLCLAIILLVALFFYGAKIVRQISDLVIYYIFGIFPIITSIVDGGQSVKNAFVNFLKDVFNLYFMGFGLYLYFILNNFFIKQLQSITGHESGLTAFLMTQIGFTMIALGLGWWLLDGSGTIEKLFGIDVGASKGTMAALTNRALASAGNISSNFADTLENGANSMAKAAGVNSFKDGVKEGFNDSKFGESISNYHDTAKEKGVDVGSSIGGGKADDNIDNTSVEDNDNAIIPQNSNSDATSNSIFESAAENNKDINSNTNNNPNDIITRQADDTTTTNDASESIGDEITNPNISRDPFKETSINGSNLNNENSIQDLNTKTNNSLKDSPSNIENNSPEIPKTTPSMATVEKPLMDNGYPIPATNERKNKFSNVEGDE